MRQERTIPATRELTMATLPVTDIETTTLHFSPPVPNPALIASLRRDGLLHPLYVLKLHEKPLLADGFARLPLLKQDGHEEIPCCIREVRDMGEALLSAIRLRFHEATATAVEKALILQQLESFDIGEEKTAACQKAAGIPSGGDLLAVCKALRGLDEAVLARLQEARIGLKQLRGLTRFGVENGLAFLQGSALRLQLNSNQIRRSLELLGDIRLAGGETQPFLNWHENATDGNLPQETRDFFSLLEEARFPQFSRLADRFKRLRAATLPRIQVDHNNFDSERLTFRFDAASADEAAEKAVTIMDNKSGVGDLYKLLGADPE